MTTNPIPPTTSVSALADRCEAATGPDRVLAKDIFRAVFPDRVPTLGHPNGYGWREDEGGWWLATGEDARTPPQTIYPPNWLGSLDAAMTLLPGPDWEWSLEWESGSLLYHPDITHYACAKIGDPILRMEAECVTPALALCAASLRAIALQENSNVE